MMRRRSVLGALGAGLATAGGCLGAFETLPESDASSGSRSIAADGEWPMRGRTLRNARATADATPVSGDPDATTLSFETIPHAVAVAELAYVGVGSSVIALDPETNETAWRQDLGNDVVDEPVVADETVVVPTERGLVGLDSESGERRWRALTATAERGGRDSANAPVVFDGTVYFTSTRPSTRGSAVQHLYAVALDDGSERWRTEVASSETTVAGSAAVTDGNYLYVGGGAYDLATGERRWRHGALDGETDWRYGPPTIADGRAYLTAASGIDGPSFVAAVDAESGTERWRREVEFAEGGVTAVGDTLYSGGVALDDESGETRWRVGPAGSPHAVVDDHHYTVVGTAIRDLDPGDGRSRWTYTPFSDYSSVVVGAPTVDEGRVYVGAAEYNVGTARLLVFE